MTTRLRLALLVLASSFLLPFRADTQGTGLVAAYGFEEANDATVTDVSGNGNAGTITAATRTGAGKYGGGLTFNGSSAYVRVPDAASLDLGSAGTVAAWVYQTSALRDAGIVHKGQVSDFSDEAYSLQFSTTTRRPEVWLSTSSNSRVVTAPTALSLNAWHHIATTWDGAGVRIYINGVLSTSSAGGFTPQNSPGALFLGAQTPGFKAFAGTLDEVRIYNRALSVAEIAQAMNTPLGGGAPPDTTPPTVSTVTAPASPLSGIVALSTTASDNSGVAPAVQFLLNGQPLGGPVAGPSPYSLQWNTTTVANGTYGLSARATDGAGLSTTSGSVSVTVSNLAPPAAPTLSGLAPTAGPVGTNVVITGANFGATQGTSTVRFGGTLAAPGSWSATSITVPVPAGAATGPVTITVGSQTSNGITFTVSTPPPSGGLVAAYGFEEANGAAILDSSGNGNTGTLTNAARTASGRFGRGVRFSAAAYASVPDSSSLDLGATGTISAWVSQTSAVSNAGLVHKGQLTNFGDEAYSLQFSSTSRRPRLDLTNASSTQTATATSSGAVPLGAWHHVAATWDNAGIKIYINGVLNNTVSGAFTPRNSTGALILGAQVPGQYALDGTLDEVRIYNRALSLAELQAVKDAPLGPADTTPPTVSPVSAPASPLSGIVTLSATASDNSGVAPTVQFLLNGQPLGGPVAGPSPYALQWDTRTVVSGAYTLSARATDAADLSTTSGVVNVTVSNADTTPPEVHILTPTDGSSVSGTIQVSAEVHHPGDLAGVQFFLDDTTPLGPELPPGPTYIVAWNVGSLTGSHTVTARARDATGNWGSDSVTVNTNAPPVVGLKAAYALNETFGAGVPDSSGNNKTGTLYSGTWTAGKYGNALSFTNGYVFVPDQSSLDVTSAGTVSAWVKPSAALGYGGIVHKGQAANFSDEAFSLQGENGRPSIWINSGTSTRIVTATTTLAVGEWRYVTATWNASGIKLYIDGVLSASTTSALSARNSTGGLLIGSQYPGGYPFQGLIDEVRIYDRALTVSEILADMTAPLGDGQLPPSGPMAVSPGDVLNTQYFGWNPVYANRQDGDYAYYSLQTTAGTTYTLSTSNAGGGTTTDTYLYLIDPFGAIVASDDNSGGNLAARIVHQAATSGTYIIKLRAKTVGTYGYATLSISAGAPPSPPVYPDLVVWKSLLNDVRIVNSGAKLLNFSSGAGNLGPGELIVYGVVQPDGTTFGYQRVRNQNGSITDHLVGTFSFPGHGTHNHWHFDNFQNYFLRAAPAGGGVGAILRSSNKVSFCITDSAVYNSSVPNAARYAVHTCTSQGISIGWGDIYDRNIEGQNIDITGVADGTYWLEVAVDPAGGMLETNKANNVDRIKIRITGNSVVIVP